MGQSVWREHIKIRSFLPLNGDTKVDVLIIGGGLSGILCAYLLDQEEIDYLLVEKNSIASGITENTTAKITSQHGLIYDSLIRTMGSEKAAMYLWANQNALEMYRILSQTMDFDFEEKTAFVYTRSDREKIENEVKAVNKLGFSAQFVEHLTLPVETKGAIAFSRQAQFQPLKLIAELSKDLNICENTFVKQLEGHTARTNFGNITAEKIIIATHFPFLNRHGGYFMKLYQERSYVLALEDAAEVEGMYLDESKEGLSFRNYQNLLFLGGGTHRSGKGKTGWEYLQEFARSNYPKAILRYHWAAQDCMSLDLVPYIGKYSKRTPDWYVATGFHKWGMTSSMVAAMLLRDHILGNDIAWGEVFSPSRSLQKKQWFRNGAEAAKNFLKPSFPRCSHMGCALKWNPKEHTWECPCHGSRFHETGEILDNPANKDLFE